MGPSDPQILSHLDALRRYARSLARGGLEADDLVHDALVRAYDKRHTYRAEGDLKAWLLTILHNTFVNTIRRDRAEAARIDRAWSSAPSSADPVQEHAVELARVQGAFVNLPEDQRAVLHLVVGEGLTYQEVAQVLRLPIGTVMSRLSRARAALRPGSTAASAPPTERARARLRVVGGADGR